MSYARTHLDEAVEIIAACASEKIAEHDDVVWWKFFDERDECFPVPCAGCADPRNPRLTEWWGNVFKWSAEQRERGLAVGKEFGVQAETDFIRKRKQHHKRLRTELSDAWSAKHPKMTGKWRRDNTAFEVEFPVVQESDE